MFSENKNKKEGFIFPKIVYIYFLVGTHVMIAKNVILSSIVRLAFNGWAISQTLKNAILNRIFGKWNTVCLILITNTPEMYSNLFSVLWHLLVNHRHQTLFMLIKTLFTKSLKFMAPEPRLSGAGIFTDTLLWALIQLISIRWKSFFLLNIAMLGESVWKWHGHSLTGFCLV